MNQWNRKRNFLVNTGSLVVALAATTAIFSCKKQEAASSEAPADSSSAESAPTGPCALYANHLCDVAGAESPTCGTVRAATELMSPDTCTAGLKDMKYSEAKILAGQKLCDDLVQKVCEAVGPKTKTCEKVTADTKRFPIKKCRAMTADLANVIADAKQMEDSLHRALSAELQTAIVKDAPVAFGPADAKVQMVEFTDFECPACARMAHVIKQIHDQYGDRIHFTFRQYPLVKHPHARIAAEAAVIANTQGKFWEFHDLLYENQAQLDRPGLEEQAKQPGLNVATFKKSLDGHKFAATVEDDVTIGDRVPVQRTPTIYINGVHVDNAANYEQVEQMIENALNGLAPG